MDADTMARELLALIEGLPRGAPQRLLQDVNKGEFFLLNYLLAHGGAARPGEMSRAMGATTARVAAALGSMERKGWVTRESDAEDHRRTWVRITPDGEAFAAGMRGRLLSGLKQMLLALGERDASEYLRILGKIRDIFLHT